MRILGVNAIGHHDASACLIEDGVITAFIEEERLTRSKHAVLQRPINAVRWCLGSRSLRWRDIDVLATPWVEEDGVIAPLGYDEELSFGQRELGNDIARWPSGLTDLYSATGGARGDAPNLLQVSHHLAHAASAYWCGGMAEATVVVVDGEGDRVSTTVAHGRGGEIASLRQYSTVDSLGQFYACLTSYLGFGDFGEGKLMGLAPYGTPAIDFPQIVCEDDGSYHIDLPGDLRRFDPAGSDWQAIIASWMKVLGDRFGPLRPTRDKPRPSLLEEWPILDRDLAASTQQTLADVMTHICRAAIRATGSPNLVLAGGVALNCAANGVLAAMPEVENLFVQPVAGDNGAPIGAALHAAALAGVAPMTSMRSVALGPAFSAADCATALTDAGVQYREAEDIATAAARALADGRVVCWFQGPLEAGPRALGHRSILASPSSATLRDRINEVKRRSLWRPLAPSVRVEDKNVFVAGRISPFMIVADQVATNWQEHLQGVTHVDATARPQTVAAEVNPVYWRLIDQHRAATGLPAIVNTSFNGEDEPIVCTPKDAVRAFLRGGADVLCLGPFLAERPSETVS